MHALATMGRSALRDMVDEHVFVRGSEYYKKGAVKEWSLSPHGRSSVRIEGRVEGTEIYSTELVFDLEARHFSHLACSCPYEVGCKHLVALGLQFIELLETFEKYTAGIPIVNSGAARDSILDFARARSQGTKLSVREKEALPETHHAHSAHESPTVAPSRNEYYLRLSSDLTPSVGVHGRVFSPRHLESALSLPTFTAKEHALFSAIKDGEFDPHTNPGRDFADFIQRLSHTDLQVFAAQTDASVPLTFEKAAAPLKAALKLVSVSDESDGKLDGFALTMPAVYWRARQQGAPSRFVAGEHWLAHLTRKKVTLYSLPTRLGYLIARVEEAWIDTYDHNFTRHPHSLGFRAILTGEEVWELEGLMQEMKASLKLTAALPKIHAIERSDKAIPTLAVDYHAKEETVRVRPLIDYGSLTQDVSESVHATMIGGRRHLTIRRKWSEAHSTHRIKIDGDVVRIAPINADAEISLFQKVAREAESLGFVKGLQLSRSGAKQLTLFMKSTLPHLRDFAAREGCVVTFVSDTLGYDSSDITAKFSIDMNAKEDWLHFDVELYCNGERLSLEDIEAFIESGEPVLHRDGKIIEITNRDEMERLALMLRSFRRREDGYEGKLYHAAELNYVLTSSPHYSAVRTKSFNDFLTSTQSGKPIDAIEIPEPFDSILRPYQKEGVHWLHFLRSFRFGGILADDMGLGKTIQALTLLSMNHTDGVPSLVVCPKSLLFNWRHEAEMFAPHLRVLLYEGTPKERELLRAQFGEHDLIVASYTTVKKDESHFAHDATKFNYVVLDEAQFIKNHATKSAQIAKRLNAGYRLALTGTPLENSVSEIWSVFDFLMPGFLGAHKEFNERFHKPIMDQSDGKALAHLRAKISPFMLRRTKGEVLRELPPKIEQDMIAELGTAQNVLYQHILSQVKSEVFSSVAERGFKRAQIHILAGLMKLRQVCNHPALLLSKDAKKKHSYESAKLDLALELIDEAVEGGHKVLLFSQFTSMLDIVANELETRHIDYLYLSGKTRDRGALVEKFNTGDVPLFLISLKAGGTGLNLTAADTVIIFDPWWNPSVEMQAADRAHRIGQTKTVNVYRLLTKGTIEEKIQTLKAKKKTLADALVDSTGDLFTTLTWEDVRGLFA